MAAVVSWPTTHKKKYHKYWFLIFLSVLFTYGHCRITSHASSSVYVWALSSSSSAYEKICDLPIPISRSWYIIMSRCPMPDHPPCQIIPHPLAQSTSAPGSCKIFYDSLFSTLRLAALIEWETEIRQAGEAVLFYLENDENNALRFSHGFAVDFETLKYVRRYKSGQSSHKVV